MASKKFKSSKHKKQVQSISLSVITLIVSLIIIIPLLIVIFGSFKNTAEAQQFKLSLPSVWHFENYIHVLDKGNILQALKNSTIITAAVTLIVIVAGSLSAFVVSRKTTRYTSFVYYLFLLGMIAPIQIVTTYALLKLLNLSGTYLGVIFVETALQMPWTIFTLSGFIHNIPRELDEAAFIDGATPGKMFFLIIFPLLKPIIATAVVTTAMGAWNEFMVPLYFFNSSSKWTMPLTVYNFFGQYSSDWNYVFSDLVLTAMPITILYLCCQKYVVAGATAGAVKG
ncbi:MAG: carbohydrate ABC transporter permease [Anaerocolumna sp.]